MEHKSTISKHVIRIAAVLLPVLLLVFMPFYSKYILILGQNMPSCIFYRIFHIYCPGCGNTRSVMALAQGDILASLRFNPTPLVLLIAGALFYVEGVLRLFGKKVCLFPRKGFIYVLIIVMAVYLLVRNFIPFLTP